MSSLILKKLLDQLKRKKIESFMYRHFLTATADEDELKICNELIELIENTNKKSNYLVSKAKPPKEFDDFCGDDRRRQSLFVMVVIDAMAKISKEFKSAFASPKRVYELTTEHRGFPYYSGHVVNDMLARKLPFTREQCLFMLNRMADIGAIAVVRMPFIKRLVRRSEEFLESEGQKDPAFDSALQRLAEGLFHMRWHDNAKVRGYINQLRAKDAPAEAPLVLGEAWSDAVRDTLLCMQADQKALWTRLLLHCIESDAGRPSKVWMDKGKEFVEQIGRMEFKETVFKWFPCVDKLPSELLERRWNSAPDPNLTINDKNASVIKGLVWCCSLFDESQMARCLRDLAISTYKPIAVKGPRAPKIGNACIYALGHMDGMEGLHHLAYLRVKIRFKTAQSLIQKALNETAARLSVTADDLEEMSVPGYGLNESGIVEQEAGEYIGVLKIYEGNKSELMWNKQRGKPQKTIPAAVKSEYAETVKELKQAAKDIQMMVSVQKERIQQLYLRKREWDWVLWKERYLEHPLVGLLARRLLWKFKKGEQACDGIFYGGTMVDVEGKPIDLGNGENVRVELWHPIRHDAEYIKKWRARLTELKIKQPFKQAHREIYVLTDAERQTRVYSNRYAAHIVKQHQFNALCAARGWRNTLKLMVDADYPPPSLILPEWNLRAEFWTDGVGEVYGQDTNETGTFNYLATDQVRFFSVNAPQARGHASARGQVATSEPIPLDQIDVLVFSEVMRDIDLFVGVASVGNDPTWADSGAAGHQSYWYRYSFGDLSQLGETRKEVLMDLVPRLAIANHCSFEGAFLRVQGKIRAYKIHLGSGNILMEPNDQYLCIVKDGSKERERGIDKLFLPFEGDITLSVIISKALLLANDSTIKDQTIVNQIKSLK